MNKFNIKNTAIALSTSLFLLSAPLAIANNDAGEKHVKAHKWEKRMSNDRSRLKHMARYLQFTDEQRTAVKDIASRTKEAMKPLKEQMKVFREDVKAMSNSSNFDEALFADAYEQNKETFYQMALLKAKMSHEIAQLMTDEQKAKWEAKKASKRANRT